MRIFPLIIVSCLSIASLLSASTTATSSLSFDGVTINFDQEYPVGYFIDGYPYVVGPAEIVSYTPACETLANGRVINGAMIDPDCGKEIGLDSIAGGNKWNPALNVGDGISAANPLTLQPDESLIIAISNPAATDPEASLKRAIVLTCLATTPPADAFRPTFANAPKTIYTWSQVNANALRNLGIVGVPPSWSSVEYELTRFAQDIVPDWDRKHYRMQDHTSLYGRDMMPAEGLAYLMVNSDFPLAEKQQTLIYLIQRGIDRYGVFQNAKANGKQPWRADGGHNSGRKFSIMFAGRLLGVGAMEDVTLQTDYTNIASSERFHEDTMTFYVDQNFIDITNSAAWDPAYGDDLPQQPYSQAMLGMPDWRGNHEPEHTSASWSGHKYRMAPNAGSQHGQALSALVMSLRGAWRNDAYFDYHARYLAIMKGELDPWGTQRGSGLSYDPVTGSRPTEGFKYWEACWGNGWLWAMIHEHWHDYYDYPWETGATVRNPEGEIFFGSDNSSYSDQDLSGDTDIAADRESISLTGNNWKRFPLPYNVTANTVLEFTIDATDCGEVIGVGLDEDNNITNAKRVFQVGGVQSWVDGWPITPDYTPGSGAGTYTISVGDYYTGAMQYLVLVADDDVNASTDATFFNLRLYEDIAPANTSLDANGQVRLGDADIESYADQDFSGTTSISPTGYSATFTGNNWKRFPLNYDVTPDTMLEFTVNALDQGEIISVGLDEDNIMSNDKRIFQAGGSQDWVNGWLAGPRYLSGSADVPYYVPVGQYYTGEMQWLVLAADDDGDGSTHVTLSGIRIYEAKSAGENTSYTPAMEDTYSRDGIYANNNYGSSLVLRLKDVNYTNYRRKSFIKFPVSELVGASSVSLVLPVDALGTEGSQNFLVEVRQCDDNWNEHTLTWNNQPATGSLISSFELTSADVGNSVVLDVTSYVVSEASGDGEASFMVVQPTNTNRLIQLSFRESPTVPMLESQHD